MVDTTIGERIAPTIVIVTTGDSDSHATHMCRAPPKPSPTPSPQPVICVYCGSSEHRSMECRSRPRDNREEGRLPQSSILVGTPETDNENLPQHLATIHRGLMLGPEIVKRLGPLATNHRDRRTGRQHQQPPQCPTQGKPSNQSNFPYRDYRYSDQPRQTRF